MLGLTEVLFLIYECATGMYKRLLVTTATIIFSNDLLRQYKS
jgi:hypothetical protein